MFSLMLLFTSLLFFAVASGQVLSTGFYSMLTSNNTGMVCMNVQSVSPTSLVSLVLIDLQTCTACIFTIESGVQFSILSGITTNIVSVTSSVPSSQAPSSTCTLSTSLLGSMITSVLTSEGVTSSCQPPVAPFTMTGDLVSNFSPNPYNSYGVSTATSSTPTACVQCTSSLSSGWCKDSGGSCNVGTVIGPASGAACSAWVFYPSQCTSSETFSVSPTTTTLSPVPTAPPTNCLSCIEVPNFGWCAASSTCVPGTINGSSACDYNDWYYTRCVLVIPQVDTGLNSVQASTITKIVIIVIVSLCFSFIGFLWKRTQRLNRQNINNNEQQSTAVAPPTTVQSPMWTKNPVADVKV